MWLWDLCDEWCLLLQHPFTKLAATVVGDQSLTGSVMSYCTQKYGCVSKASGPSFLRPHQFQDSEGFGQQAPSYFIPATRDDPNVPQKGLLFELIFQLLQEAHNSARLEFVASLRWILTHARWPQLKMGSTMRHANNPPQPATQSLCLHASRSKRA